jgi:hypothetical protein
VHRRPLALPATRTAAARLLAAALLPAALLPVWLPVGAATAVEEPPVIGSVELGGSRVEPSTNPGDPTMLTAGLWSDELGPGGTADATHEYGYVRTMAGSTVHVAVTASPDDPLGDTLELTAVTPAGDPCGSDTDNVSAPVPQSPLGVGLVIGPDEPGSERVLACASAAELRFTVTHSSETPRGVALRIVEEAPVGGDPTALPVPPEDPVLDVPTPQEGGEEVAGAPSFTDAPDLAGATTYVDTVAQGEVVLYRVRLDWGQSLTARVDVPVMDAETEETLGFVRPDVALTLLDPLRQVVVDQVDDDVTREAYDVDEPVRLVDATAPVAHLNRFAGLAATVPGDYWVSLAVEPPDPGATPDGETAPDPVEVPVELTVAVTGEPGAAPTYPENVLGPGGAAGPEGYDASTPFLVGAGELAATVTGVPEDAGGAGAGDDGLDAQVVAGAALGAVSLACVLAGAVLLLRRTA